MRMLRRGQVSVREAAQIAMVSRQRVLEWCKAAGIDPKAARDAWLATVLDRLNRLDANPKPFRRTLRDKR
jgi:hypothetical protein